MLLLITPVLVVWGCDSEQQARQKAEPETPRVANGRATFPDGSTVWLIGACDLSASKPVPWDSNGKVLDAAQAKLFWDGLDADRLEHFRSGEEDRSFALVFGYSSKWTLMPPIEDHKSKFDLYMMTPGRGPKDPKASTATIGLIFKPKDKTKPLDFRMLATGGEWRTVAKFKESDEFAPDGFEFESLQRARTTMFVQSKESREEMPVIRTTWVVTVPPNLLEEELQLITNDVKPTGKLEGALMFGPGVKGELLDPKHKGKRVFMVQHPDKPDFDREYSVQARKQYMLTFPGIPLKALP